MPARGAYRAQLYSNAMVELAQGGRSRRGAL